MSTSNLSAAANETLQSCGQTAEALIGACRSGGNRVIGRVDAGWDGLVARGGARLSEQLRHDLVAAQREVSGFYAKGVDALSKLSTQAVQAVVKAATAGVDRLSGRVTSLEAMLAPLPLSSAIVIVQPIAAAGRDARTAGCSPGPGPPNCVVAAGDRKARVRGSSWPPHDPFVSLMGVWNAYRRLADQYARAWSAGIGCVSDKWADAIDYSGFVLPVAAVNVRSAVSSVPGGTRLVAWGCAVTLRAIKSPVVFRLFPLPAGERG